MELVNYGLVSSSLNLLCIWGLASLILNFSFLVFELLFWILNINTDPSSHAC